MKEIIIDGVRHVPEKKKSDTQGYTDRELINRGMCEGKENEDPAEVQKKYDEAHRVW